MPAYVICSYDIADPKGYVAHVWPSVKVEGHAEDVRRKIEELRAAA